MADNINLTVADINNLKNAQNSATTRLDIKNFIFDSDANATAGNEQMPIVPGGINDGRGIRLYAAKSKQYDMKGKTKMTVPFDLNGTGWTTQINPVVIVTVEGESSINTAKLMTWVEVSSSKVTVHVEPKSKLSTSTPFKINILAIGYA